MFGDVFAILLPFGVLFVAAGFAYALSTSKAEDPKLRLLDSLIRLVNDG